MSRIPRSGKISKRTGNLEINISLDPSAHTEIVVIAGNVSSPPNQHHYVNGTLTMHWEDQRDWGQYISYIVEQYGEMRAETRPVPAQAAPQRALSTLRSAPQGYKTVESISISDMSAIRVLYFLDDTMSDIYTGSVFGMLISILRALKVPKLDIIEGFKDYGQYLTKQGFRGGFIKYAKKFIDQRTLLGGLEGFVKALRHDVETLKVKDLKADIYIPVLSVTQENRKNQVGVICKELTPGLPVIGAVQAAFGSFIDYEPVEVKKESKPEYGLGPVLSYPGVIWSYPSIGRVCSDLSIARRHDFKNLSFNSFFSPLHVSSLKKKTFKKLPENTLYHHANDIGHNYQLPEVIETLTSHPGVDYRYTLLSTASNNFGMSRAEIEKTLSSQPITIELESWLS